MNVNGYIDHDAADERLRDAFAKLRIAESASDRERTLAHQAFLRLILGYDDLLRETAVLTRTTLDQLLESAGSQQAYKFDDDINRELALLVKAIVQPVAALQHQAKEIKSERMLELPLASQPVHSQRMLVVLDEVLTRTTDANGDIAVVPFKSDAERRKRIFQSSEHAIRDFRTTRQQLIFTFLKYSAVAPFALMSGAGPFFSLLSTGDMFEDADARIKSEYFILPALIALYGGTKANNGLGMTTLRALVNTHGQSLTRKLVVNREVDDKVIITTQQMSWRQIAGLVASTVLFSIPAGLVFFSLTLQSLAESRSWFSKEPSKIYADVSYYCCGVMLLTLATIFMEAYAGFLRQPSFISFLRQMVEPFENSVFYSRGDSI